MLCQRAASWQSDCSGHQSHCWKSATCRQMASDGGENEVELAALEHPGLLDRGGHALDDAVVVGQLRVHLAAVRVAGGVVDPVGGERDDAHSALEIIDCNHGLG